MSSRPVTFRYRPDAAVSLVLLRGNMEHWLGFHPMTPGSSGGYETTLRVPPGAYSYKFMMSGEQWALDPDNPRTRARDGVQNSLLVVGGSEEPLLHAPARPFLHVDDDGQLILRAGLRRGHGTQLRVRWDEGHGPVETPLMLVTEEDEHLLFETALPASARWISYLFLLEDGCLLGQAGGAGQAFQVALDKLLPDVPAWWRNAVLYSVFIDRFRRGGSNGRWDHASLGPQRQGRAGGDLDGVVEALPYLADLGVTALHLTPIVAAHSSHRYDAVDTRSVDPALGGEAGLARLFDAAERVGLRVLLDVTVTHVHRDFFAFRDVIERGPRSPYWKWFRIRGYPFADGAKVYPGYDHYPKGAWQEPLLQNDEPEVMEYLVGTFAHWARLGAHGFRVDAAADAPLSLLVRIREAVRAIRKDAVVYGEVLPDNLYRFRAGLDAATDFPAAEAAIDWLWRGTAGAARLGYVLGLRRYDCGGPGYTRIGFTATHDQHRLLTLTQDAALTRLGHLMLLLGAAVPAIYYGDEVGLRGVSIGRTQRDFEDAWADRAPMAWADTEWDRQTHDLFRTALRLRRTHAALHVGDERYLPPSAPSPGDPEDTARCIEDVLILRRSAGQQVIDTLFHRGTRPCEVLLPADAPSAARVLLVLGDAVLDEARGCVRLGARAAIVLERVAPAEAEAALAALTRQSRLLGALAFQQGLCEVPCLPSHLYLTVTEVCNLRCAHCITDAPARTREGRARTVHPWLLDALREVFCAADYIAFVHGGESLMAPGFFDVLAAIGRARGDRPGRPVIHLLSNGMLLDEERVARLIGHGVSSLSVSLDGASGPTNDRIRSGGRFSRIVAQLRDIAAARRRHGTDLRLGVSTVVMESNLDELVALGHLVVELGLDWLKVEEVEPCTPLARHEYVAPHDRRLAEAMAELRALFAATDVVLVEHMAAPGGCPCQAASDPALAAFRRADDFANRAVFHPCRAAWEQAAVDPDGTVHLVDYDHPPLGRLHEASFFELWNNEVAQRLRSEALRRFPAALRCACPISRERG